MKKAVLLLTFVLLLLAVGQAQGAVIVQGSELTKTDTILDDFTYEIKDDRIVFTSYNGEANSIIIESKYTLGGREYTTDINTLMLRYSKELSELVLEEGIESFYEPMFNGSYIEKLFFPHSLQYLSGKQLSFLKPRKRDNILVFYAGTKEEFIALVSSSSNGSATDVKVDNLAGTGFTSSDFVFVFEATVDDFYSGEFD